MIAPGSSLAEYPFVIHLQLPDFSQIPYMAPPHRLCLLLDICSIASVTGGDDWRTDLSRRYLKVVHSSNTHYVQR
jgi:hypothetical protein